MFSRTTLTALRRNLPSVFGHHHHAAAAATAATTTASHHVDTAVAAYHRPPVRFTPIAPPQIRRGWYDDDNAGNNDNDEQPLIRLRWEDVMDTHTQAPTPTTPLALLTEEIEKIVEVDLPETAQPSPLIVATPEKPATSQEPPEEPIATHDELVVCQAQEQQQQQTLEPPSLQSSLDEAEDEEMEFLKSLLDGIAGDGHHTMERLQARYPLPTNTRMQLTYQVDHKETKSPSLAPRRTATATWMIHKPVNNNTSYQLPEFEDIRSTLSGRSQSRLRLRCRADAAKMLQMLERPEEYRDALAAFLTRIGDQRQRKILAWVPELKPPLLRFIKIVMRRQRRR